MEREVEREAGERTDTNKQSKTGRQIDIQAGRQTHRHTNGQKHRRTGRQTDEHTDAERTGNLRLVRSASRSRHPF